MSQLILAKQTVSPSTPASGKGAIFLDSASAQMASKSDAGRIILLGGTYNASIAAQAGFASDTYLTDSDLLIPSFGLQARSRFEWKISASKTGAGVATPVYTIRTGSLRTTSDTSRLALTGPAQTAAADIGILTILVTVRVIGASAVIAGSANWSHNGAAAGFCNNDSGSVEATSSTFDSTALAGYISLTLNGGTSAAWTITQVHASAQW